MDLEPEHLGVAHCGVPDVDTELRQTHLNALERATIIKTINTAKTLGGPV